MLKRIFWLIAANAIILGVLIGLDAGAGSFLGVLGAGLLESGFYVFCVGLAIFLFLRRRWVKAQQKRPEPGAPRQYFWAHLPFITLFILVVTSLTSLWGFDLFYPAPRLTTYFAGLMLDPVAVEHGEYYRLLSVTLLHASVLHLGLNMLALVYIGIMEGGEKLFGSWRFLGIYLTSGLGASAASVLFTHEASVGASGAIMGILGALIAGRLVSIWTLNTYPELSAWATRKHRSPEKLRKYLIAQHKSLNVLFQCVALTLGLGLFLVLIGQPMFDNAAHTAGLVTGFILGGLYYRRTILILARRRAPASAALPKVLSALPKERSSH
jgi:membrane associated rhomboid family serine protease